MSSQSLLLPVRWANVGNKQPLSIKHSNGFFQSRGTNLKRSTCVYAEYKKGGAGDFVTGFVVGGVIFGALGCIFAPQVNQFFSVVEKELDESLKKLPKGLDDDGDLEKTRRNLNEKIAELNAAIDDISAQLKTDDESSGQVGYTAEVEAGA